MPSTRPSANAALPVKLQFDDKLTGRGLSSDGLQRKLKTLLDELTSITESEAENIDLASFATVRKDLITPSLMLHKDKGVKAYVACCIAELLNVYAPDAPYTAGELKDIFQFFFKQLMNGLKGQDAPYYQLYHDLLASLSRTKSAVLVCDLPHADELLAEIFRDFFTLASLGLPTPIEAYMSDIMAALLDECTSVPSDVMEILIAQFNAKKKAVSANAFRVAVDVCNASSDKLVRPVSQYFTDTIAQHPYEDHEGDDEDGEGGRDYDAIQAAHALVKKMHRYCPKLLLSVIPQLQEEMSMDNVPVRLLATQTLGEMFGQVHHGVELMRGYRSTWVQWIARKNDKTPMIRLAFVETAKKLIGVVEMKADIDEAMRAKAFDPDDKVRAAVCKAYGELDFETVTYHVSEDTLRQIGSRCLDKKHTVRLEAFDTMGKLYSHAKDEIDKGNATAVTQFSWIPAMFMKAAKQAEAIVVAEDTLARYIFPLPSPSSKEDIDEDEWTRRLLKTLTNADDECFTGVLMMSGLNASRPTPPARFVECCLEYNGGTIDKDEAAVKARFEEITKVIASRFSNPVKIEDDLTAFAKRNDRRLYKLLKTCMDLQTDLKGIVKASGDFMKIIEKEQASIAHTMQIFLRKATLWLINTSSIPTLLDIVSDASTSRSPTKSPSKSPKKANGTPSKPQEGDAVDSKTIDHSKRILSYISKHCPQLYYPHLPRLVKDIHTNATPASLEAALRALASVAGLGTDQAPSDNRLDSALIKLALGSDRINAKLAARYLSNSRNRSKNAAQVIEKLYKLLPNANDEQLASHITALSEFALYSPDEFEEKSEEIVRFILQDLIYREVNKDEMETDDEKAGQQDEAEWCPKDDLEPLVLAKCQVLRLLSNRCLAHKKDEDATKTSGPVIKLLLDTLDRDGSFSHYEGDEAERDRLKDSREGSAAARSWIRLKATNNLLRLAQEQLFSPQIIVRLPSLALVAQDFCWEVRNGFINKLTSLLALRKLQPIFNTIVFLTCHDIESNIRQRARAYVTAQLRRSSPKQRLQSFEIFFVRFLHLLAHHPDYDDSESEEGLPALAKYVEFYLDLVATSDNVSLLYHLAQHCKTIRDKDGQTYSDRLYLLSELADYAIKQRAQNQGWTIPSYPNKINMPSDIFIPLPSPAAVKTVRTTVYLTDEMIGWLGDIGKPMRSPQAKARKRRAPATTTKSKRPVKRRKKSDSSDEEIEQSDEDDEISSVAEAPAPTSDEEMSEDDDNETDDSSKAPKLGRGARSRAKAKARQKGKKSKKQDD